MGAHDTLICLPQQVAGLEGRDGSLSRFDDRVEYCRACAVPHCGLNEEEPYPKRGVLVSEGRHWYSTAHGPSLRPLLGVSHFHACWPVAGAQVPPPNELVTPVQHVVSRTLRHGALCSEAVADCGLVPTYGAMPKTRFVWRLVMVAKVSSQPGDGAFRRASPS